MIGRGWAPEVEQPQVETLAAGLLRETLDRIWSTYRERRNERQTERRHDAEEEGEA